MKHKASTCMNCSRCASPKVLTAFRKKAIVVMCNNCTKEESFGPESVIIRQLKTLPKTAKWIGIYHGPWNKDEFETTEGVVRDLVKGDPDFQEEWRFFKGRAIYSAWRWTWESGRLLTAPTLCSLLDQVERQCRNSPAR